MHSFKEFLKNELNSQQYEASTHKSGAVLVIAGAGSGKTRVITSRIANLISNEFAVPQSIIALTFTNKAAAEMKHRVEKLVNNEFGKKPFIGTFHSFCLQLLKTNPHLLNLESFSIIDGDDQQTIIKKILKNNGLEKQFSAQQILYQISQLKNAADSDEVEPTFTKPIIREIYQAYEREKEVSKSFDFDDLILKVIQIFEKNSEFRSAFQKRFRHVLVDEYQDTNLAQHKLLKLIALNTENKIALDSICAVGDEDQSIYSWRGAAPANMLKFEEHFAPVTKIKIEQNYRSAEPILEVANKLIANNKYRNPKNLWSTKKAKNRILLLNCKSDYQEADAIVEFLSMAKNKSKLNSIAILYRTHFQSRVIEEMLARHSIPYKIVGGLEFYSRKEIKDLLAYLKLVVNPFDKVSLSRIINCPTRGLGEKFEELLFMHWQENPFLNFLELIKSLIETGLVEGKKSKVLENFMEIFEGLTKNQKTSSVLEQILETTNYFNFLRTTLEEEEAQTKTENVKEFLRSIEFFENKIGTEDSTSTVETFLHEIALLQEKIENTKNSEDFIWMMTLHAAKGLEFDIVIISGLEEGLFPSSRSLNSLDSLEEERRLLYVGITRAREYLLLTKALYRNSFGNITDQSTSRFIFELPKDLIQSLDISNLTVSFLKPTFLSWLSGSKIVNDMPTISITPKHQKLILNNKNYSSATKVVPKSESITKLEKNSGWSKNQTVVHAKFGKGIVTVVEKQNEDDYFITAIFSSGIKKILSKFLKRL